MRKLLPIIICTICLCVPVTVQAEDNATNVTNQLDEILVQLDNLDAVIQFFIDNQENLQMLVEADLWNDHLGVELNNMVLRINDILTQVKYRLAPSVDNIEDDVESIKADVAALSADLAVYVSQVVASINGVSAEVEDLHQWLINIELARIQYLLTQAQLDESLNNLFFNFENNSSMLANYSSTLAQILQSIQSLDYSERVIAALYNIERVLDDFGGISVYIDLVEELENMDLNFDLDLGTALSRLEGDLGSVLSTTEHISYLFEVFINLFSLLKNDQEATNEDVRDFLYWYQNSYFPGLRNVLTAQSVWLERQEAREEAEAEHRDKESIFYADDVEFPTEHSSTVEAELRDVELDEPELPDDQIDAAQQSVSSDMKEVEDEILDEMEEVDAKFSSFLDKMNVRWGSFNSVLSFSFKIPHGNYTMNFSYDFSKSDMLPPIRAVTSGIWAIILFVESYLAISSAFHDIIKN